MSTLTVMTVLNDWKRPALEAIKIYTLEEVYLAFKERLINEISVRSDELLKDGELVDYSQNEDIT